MTGIQYWDSWRDPELAVGIIPQANLLFVPSQT